MNKPTVSLHTIFNYHNLQFRKTIIKTYATQHKEHLGVHYSVLQYNYDMSERQMLEYKTFFIEQRAKRHPRDVDLEKGDTLISYYTRFFDEMFNNALSKEEAFKTLCFHILTDLIELEEK